MGHDITKKQIIEIVLVVVGLGIGLFVYDYYQTVSEFDGTISRNEAGSGNKNEKLSLTYDENTSVVTVDIEEKKLTESQADEAFDKAEKEIDETFLGQNNSAGDVSKKLDVRTEYVNGLVKASWSFSDFRVVSNDGVIDKAEAKEDTVLEGEALLTCQDYSRIYRVHFMVLPFDATTEEGRSYLIDKAVQEADEKSCYDSDLELPSEVDGIQLSWEKPINYRGLALALLGIVTGLLLFYGSRLDAKKEREALQKEKERDYPMIVNELSILMGAGMSLRAALERITKKYLHKRGIDNRYIRAGYEEMLITYRQMQDGVGELAALENLGVRCDQKEYRKLALLLSQNIRKGSKDLTYALEKEEAVAFEMRKQQAMRLGEEASTKLLIPMTGMLIVVIVVLIVPAIMQMNM